MNKNTLPLLLFLILAITSVQAKKNPLPPTKIQYVNLGPHCYIRAAIPFGGKMGGGYDEATDDNNGGIKIQRFPVKTTYSYFATSLKCYNISDLHFPKGWSVRYDAIKKRWIKDFSQRSYAGNYKDLDKATKVYTIQAKNSSGFVYTEDELTGDEWQRERKMTFCLLHPPKALCGDGMVMKLNDPKSNVLPYVFKILRSMEFIDEAPKAPVSPSTQTLPKSNNKS